MITDKEFDTVYFSDYLKNPLSEKDQGFARIYHDLEELLLRYGYEPRLLPYKKRCVMDGQLSVWCRDYMPVHTVRGDLVQFSYNPDYLKFKKYEGHIPDPAWVCSQIGVEAATFSDEKAIWGQRIVLDGGNIVRCGDFVVMTDKVFEENRQYSRAALTQVLVALFQAEIIFLPWDRREYLGHSDGILRHLSGNKVVMSPYGNPAVNKRDRSYDQLFRQALEAAGLEVLTIDYSGITEAADFRWAYTNWLQLKGLIILPAINGFPQTNERVYAQIEQFTRRSKLAIEMVDATELLRHGGVLNCASWTTTQAVVKGID